MSAAQRILFVLLTDYSRTYACITRVFLKITDAPVGSAFEITSIAFPNRPQIECGGSPAYFKATPQLHCPFIDWILSTMINGCRWYVHRATRLTSLGCEWLMLTIPLPKGVVLTMIREDVENVFVHLKSNIHKGLESEGSQIQYKCVLLFICDEWGRLPL